MNCKNCGNKSSFLVVVTDYKPLEMWEINDGVLTRYNQKDTGDMEIQVECGACGSSNVDRENFDMDMYSDRPLVMLSEPEWEEKVAQYRKEEPAEEEEKPEEKPE